MTRRYKPNRPFDIVWTGAGKRVRGITLTDDEIYDLEISHDEHGEIVAWWEDTQTCDPADADDCEDFKPAIQRNLPDWF